MPRIFIIFFFLFFVLVVLILLFVVLCAYAKSEAKGNEETQKTRQNRIEIKKVYVFILEYYALGVFLEKLMV